MVSTFHFSIYYKLQFFLTFQHSFIPSFLHSYLFSILPTLLSFSFSHSHCPSLLSLYSTASSFPHPFPFPSFNLITGRVGDVCFNLARGWRRIWALEWHAYCYAHTHHAILQWRTWRRLEKKYWIARVGRDVRHWLIYYILMGSLVLLFSHITITKEKRLKKRFASCLLLSHLIQTTLIYSIHLIWFDYITLLSIVHFYLNLY